MKSAFLSVLLALLLVSIAFAGVEIPRPAALPESDLIGQRQGICEGGKFIEERGYSKAGSETMYAAVYVYGGVITAWLLNEQGKDFDVAVVAFPGGKYEKMSFDELVARFPSPCDLPLMSGGDA